MRLKSASRKCGAEENCVCSDLLEPRFWYDNVGLEIPFPMANVGHALSFFQPGLTFLKVS